MYNVVACCDRHAPGQMDMDTFKCLRGDECIRAEPDFFLDADALFFLHGVDAQDFFHDTDALGFSHGTAALDFSMTLMPRIFP